MSTDEKRIFGLVCVSGLAFLALTVLGHSVDAVWLDVVSGAVGSVAFLVLVWLQFTRARREPAYARYVRYATLAFVPWFALMHGLAFVVPKGWRLEYAVGGVALLVLLRQLAKRLARPSAISPEPPA
jgi:hypothetical protein